MSDVVIVDSGVANLASVRFAFSRLGAHPRVSSDANVVRSAARLVIPGVGSFGAGMAALRSRRLDDAIRSAIEQGTPVLAICLGLQMLAEASDENPGVAGLGVLKGTCTRLPDEARIPHLGWNTVMPDESCRMLAPMEASFANSFALANAPAGWSAAWTSHGRRFVAGVERDNVIACQFHPELSGRAGADLLDRWLNARAVPLRNERSRRTAGLAVRIVPCLDVRDGRVVKGIRFRDLRDAGDPADLAARYESQGADEVVLLDIAASPSQRETQVDVVRRVRAVLSIPLTVGGGVRTIDDARRLLSSGADKVSVNTAAVARPELITELAMEFGRQCVVLAIDAGRQQWQQWLPIAWDVMVMGGRKRANGLSVVPWAAAGVAAGAGEILLTSWDRDGTRGGADLPLLRAVSAAVNVPVIASGGIGSSDHVVEAFAAGADAVLAASVFHDAEETVMGIKNQLTGRGFRVRL